MAAPASPDAIRDVNTRYHDAAARSYDAKWGVDFGPIGEAQVLGKVRKALGPAPGPFARSLEIGAGTGYFSLNMLQAGVVRDATCTDISPGMLGALEANAGKLGLAVETVACDAAELPFEDATFDLVLGGRRDHWALMSLAGTRLSRVRAWRTVRSSAGCGPGPPAGRRG